MRRALWFTLALAAILGATPSFSAVPGDLAPLTFLLGEWGGVGTGSPGDAGGRAVFSTSLQDRVILRTSFAEYPASKDKPASRHDDLMVIYSVPSGGMHADYFDNEGHVIRYDVAVPEAGAAIFISETTAGEPRFRLTYHLGTDGVLKGGFAIAPPGQSDAFKDYLTWESHKVKAE